MTGGRRRSLNPGRASATVIAVLVALGWALLACGQPASPTPSFPASPVDGVIISVDASSLSDVRGFTLLTPSGERIAFTLGTLENPTEFPPGHLAEHEATSVAVRVSFRVENGVPIVYRLADAVRTSPAASPAAT